MRKEIKKQLKKNKIKANYNWIIKVTLMAFIISIIISSLSEAIIPNVNIIISIIILLIFISVGIIFDMIGVSVTVADSKPFHSMSSRKIKSAKTAVMLKKNEEKVSSFCNDVIGDICGVVSGTVGVTISMSISSSLNIPLFICTLVITGMVASLTIGGKAMGKSIAINNSNEILYNFAKFINIFIK